MLNKDKGRKKTDNFSKDAKAQTGSKDSDLLTILASSAALEWEGVSIERGHTNLLVVDDFTIPKHWFGMIVSNALTWECKEGSTMKTLTTYPGQICIYPAHIPSSRRMEGYYEFISLTLEPDRLWHGINGVSSRTHNEFLCRHNVDDPQLRALMHTLMVEAEARNPNGRLFVESLTLALSIHFVKHYSAETKVIRNTVPV